MARTIMIMRVERGDMSFPVSRGRPSTRSRLARGVARDKDGMEATLVPKHGYHMEWVNFSGLRGRGAVALFLCAQAARRFLAKRARDLRASSGTWSSAWAAISRFRAG